MLLLSASLAAGADLATLHRPRAGVSHRVSSFDPTGGNKDYLTVKPGETHALARIQGPGVIRHIWATMSSTDPEYLRRIVIRFYWDGETDPSVRIPIGDLFGLGQARVTDFDSAPISVVRSPHITDVAGRGGLNLFFPMPFAREARIEVQNDSAIPLDALYYYIDYTSEPLAPSDRLRFHAVWRHEMSATAPGTVFAVPGESDAVAWANNRNTDGKGNYVLLDAVGGGHYVGCVLSVDSRATDRGKWWEGDEMIFIDDDAGVARLLGTGTEDYFGLAYGFRKVVMHPYHGVTLLEKRPDVDARYFDGLYTTYRFHVADPVVFKKRIRVTLEHGHANEAAVRLDSTAYWYQAEPHRPQGLLPPPDQRVWRE